MAISNNIDMGSGAWTCAGSTFGMSADKWGGDCDDVRLLPLNMILLLAMDMKFSKWRNLIVDESSFQSKNYRMHLSA